MDSKKILVISYSFWPDITPNTYRWNNILTEWSKQGYEVYVVSSQKAGYEVYENFRGVKVYRAGLSVIDRLRSALKSKRKSQSNSVIVHNGKENKTQGDSFIQKVYNNTWRKLYWPDHAFLWYYAARKLAEKLIEEEDIEKVITVSWPITDHRIGDYLKRKFPRIYWLADTIDPFFLSPAVNNQALYSSKNYKFEYRLLQNADHISLLTENLKKKYSELFPLLKSKIQVNHNIYIPLADSIEPNRPTADKISLVFVGTINPITRSPVNLINLFNKLLTIDDNLYLHFYGNTQQCHPIFSDLGVNGIKNITIHPFLNREDLAQVLAEADVLVNIGNNNPYQEPSKIVEYIYLGKPILNVCSIFDDSSKEPLKIYPYHYNVYEEDIENCESIKRIYSFITERHNIDREFHRAGLGKYMLPQIASKYLLMFKKDLGHHAK